MARPGEDIIDFAARELCPDGSCIGLIGADGRCKVCGKRGVRPATAAPAEESVEEPAEEEAIEKEVEGEPSFDEERELCPDGACVGLIGPDGTCKVCGTPRPS
jgi:hypothetical protein